MDIFELEELKCQDCGLQLDVSQVTSWKCAVCENAVWIIASVDERGYVLERVRARDVEEGDVVLVDETHDACEVAKAEKAQGNVEIGLKPHGTLKVKEGDFVNTVIGEWKPGDDGKPSFKIVRDKPTLLIK